MKNKFYLLSVIVFLMTGCAGVEITKITPKNADKEGIRFYRPWPYLLVAEDANGKFQTQNIYLPKTNEEYVISVKSGIGTSDVSVTLANGWQLTQYGEKRDSKIPETIGAITGAATVLEKTFEMLQAQAPPPSLAAGLYRYEFDDNGIVRGLTRVPVVQLREKEK